MSELTSKKKVSQWIDSAKRKPSKSGWYIVWVRQTKNTIATMTLAWFEYGRWRERFNFDNGHKMGRVSHWMPQPERPR